MISFLQYITGFKKKNRIVFYIIIGAVSVFLIEKLFFSGLRDRIRKFHKQIKLDELMLKESITIREKKDIILAEYNDYKKYLDTVGLPDKDVVARFLNALEKTAQDSGLSIVSLVPREQQEDNNRGYREYGADLRAEAGIEQIINFLGQIQNSSLLIKLNKLSIIPRDEEGGVLRIEMSVSIIVLK